jgi:hypothetical protein
LYQGLIEIAPNDSLREVVLRSWVRSVRAAEANSVKRIEWYMHAHDLLESILASTPKLRDEMLEGVVDSGDPGLSLYGRLAKLGIQ